MLDLYQPVLTSASHSVCLPVSSAKASRLRRSHCQMLHVPPGQVHTAPIQEGTQCNHIDFLPCISWSYYFLHYAHYEISQVSLTSTVQQCSRGNARSFGIWKRSGICRHIWNVIQPSLRSEARSTFLKYYTETRRRPWEILCVSQP